MKLAEVMEDIPYKGAQKGSTWIFPADYGKAWYRELFQLEDYVVSSVTAGSIYLIPRSTGDYKVGDYVYLLPDGRYGRISSEEIIYYREESGSFQNRGYLVELDHGYDTKEGAHISIILAHVSSIRETTNIEREQNKLGRKLDTIV